MSRQNVEIVLAAYDAFARRDAESPLADYAPDIEWDISRGAALGSAAVYRGHDGVRESFRDLLTAFSSIEFEVEKVTDAGDHVLVDIHERYVGRESGIEVDRRHYALWTLRDHKVTQMRVYRERSEALGDAGLED